MPVVDLSDGEKIDHLANYSNAIVQFTS